MTKTALKTQYDEYTSEYLLELRALGPNLTDDAHAAIEEVLTSRGVKVPRRPKQPILPNQWKRERRRDLLSSLIRLNRATLRPLLLLLVLLGGMLLLIAVFVQEYPVIGSALLLLVSGLGIAWWVKTLKGPFEDGDRERRFKQVGKRGYTELMFYAAEGDVERVRELVNYGVQIDAQDTSGATALIYATSREQTAVVRLLLSRGSNRSLATVQGQTALDIADQLSNRKLVALLSGQR
jgi:hypothetical protein